MLENSFMVLVTVFQDHISRFFKGNLFRKCLEEYKNFGNIYIPVCDKPATLSIPSKDLSI